MKETHIWFLNFIDLEKLVIRYQEKCCGRFWRRKVFTWLIAIQFMYEKINYNGENSKRAD